MAPSRLLNGIPDRSYFYFTHSYRAPQTDGMAALCRYGGDFSAIVERRNVFGVQFHPEKSGQAGLQLVENFCAL
jgi:glutamine amidotransferase